MKDNIRIYGVKDSYIKYLSQYQEHLFLHEGGSPGRKYIGVVFEINNLSYFAPLSSFKLKHKKMKESVDFIKIKDYAVININNMIPVPKGQLIELNINAEKNPHYKFLLQAESREINRQKSRIRKNAEIVYNHKKRNGNLTPLAKRTNDFEMLEKLSRDFS
ncbi:MAG: type III toxin-antitoxin system ToxN/AbiQ family toxin [Lachnospiraceae bacterium]|nr:type III toxin-antitoxin system ToxN/AbiQ family toxin [Lachnospiraceae bacterium]